MEVCVLWNSPVQCSIFLAHVRGVAGHIVLVIVVFGRRFPSLPFTAAFDFLTSAPRFFYPSSAINILTAKLLFFFPEITSRSFFLALSMLSISSILLAKFLCYICLQGIIKATAHYVLSIYGARKSHIKKCGVYCVRIYSHMYAFTHKTCKNNMCWILSP